jgi:hypothetical protein
MPSISDNIKRTRFEKAYETLYEVYADDPSEIICDNARWIEVIKERLRLNAKVANSKEEIGEIFTKPFSFLRNDSCEIYHVDDQNDLDIFMEDFDSINFGEGIIVMEL